MDIALEQAIRASLGSWPQVGPGEDANTIDIFLHARRIEEALRLPIPTAQPPKLSAVALVEQDASATVLIGVNRA